MDKKIASLLSLCRRAGKISMGEVACEKALSSKEGQLVIIARDASMNTKKKFTNKAFYYQVETVEFATKEELGKAVGSENKAVLIISDMNFAKKIHEMLLLVVE